MKHQRTLAIVVVALMSTVAVQAQVKFGVKGGMELLEMKFKDDVFNADNRSGWFIGPTLKIGLPLPGLAVDVSALYNQRESKIDLYESADRQVKTLKTKQIAVPLNLRYGLSLGSAADVFVYAGPQVAFRVGDESELISQSGENDLQWRVKNSNFSVNGGLGCTLGPIQIAANYNVAVGRTGDVTLGDAVDAAKSGLHGKYNSWQISATWYF